jgi:hypothetical protein
MGKAFRDAFCDLGAEYLGRVKVHCAAKIAKFLAKRLQPSGGNSPIKGLNVPMSLEAHRNLEILVERINRHSSRKISKSRVVAILLEKAIAYELAALGKEKKTCGLVGLVYL